VKLEAPAFRRGQFTFFRYLPHRSSISWKSKPGSTFSATVSSEAKRVSWKLRAAARLFAGSVQTSTQGRRYREFLWHPSLWDAMTRGVPPDPVKATSTSSSERRLMALFVIDVP
jgi:hypothetical protein